METITVIQTMAAGVAAIVSVCPIHTSYKRMAFTLDEKFHKCACKVLTLQSDYFFPFFIFADVLA